MAVKRVAFGPNTFYICDTEAERPAAMDKGDLSISLDSVRLFLASDPTTWVEKGGSEAHSHTGFATEGHSHAGGSRLPQTISLGAYVVLTNIGTAYDTGIPAQGLGLAVVDFTGVASVRFDVKVNKVGVGIQDWQLWNDTDGAQVALISDAGIAGVRTLTTTVTTGLPTGVKTVRVRAKSATSTDDPVYLGAALLLS